MNEAEAFLRGLFGPYGDVGGVTCEVRCIEPRSHEVTQRWFGLGAMDRAAEHCLSMAGTHDVYVGVLPRFGRGGHSRDVAGAAWLYCDIDRGEGTAQDVAQMAAAFCRRFGAAQIMVCTVSGGGHFYWRMPVRWFGTNEDRSAHAAMLKRLCRTLGDEGPGAHADRAACDVARVLRVPGTLYHKTNPPTAVVCRFREAPMRADWNGLDTLPVRVAMAIPTATASFESPADDQALLDAMFGSKHGAEIDRLWNGIGIEDESRADLSLMRRLAFWTQGDASRMERLFSQSPLGGREKWKQREDYRRRTIERALA